MTNHSIHCRCEMCRTDQMKMRAAFQQPTYRERIAKLADFFGLPESLIKGNDVELSGSRATSKILENK